jgi:hypothetical protein
MNTTTSGLQAWQRWLTTVEQTYGEGYRMRVERHRRAVQAVRQEAITGREARLAARTHARRERDRRGRFAGIAKWRALLVMESLP